MVSGLSHKTKQFFFVLIKLSIVLGAAYFIYKKLSSNEQLDFYVFIDILAKNNVFSNKNIVFLLLLTFFNWFFEISKWQNMVSNVKNIPFVEALKQGLTSHTASLLTPNRIGDYGAKAIYFKNALRKRILLLNLISNMAQMFVTLIFGIIGFSVFITQYDIDILYFNIFWFSTLVSLISILLLIVISNRKLNIKGFSIHRISKFIRSISAKIHLKNILFSIIRYLIFSFQFYYLLKIFGADLQYFDAMMVISSMYLLVSIIPTIFVFDAVVKGSVALYLFGFTDVNELTILSVTMLMWLLNFVLPSIFGSFYILNLNFNKETDTAFTLE